MDTDARTLLQIGQPQAGLAGGQVGQDLGVSGVRHAGGGQPVQLLPEIAARLGIEGVAAMHGGAVVPQHEVAHAPALIPAMLRSRRVRPQPVEQAFAFFDAMEYTAKKLGRGRVSGEWRLM